MDAVKHSHQIMAIWQDDTASAEQLAASPKPWAEQRETRIRHSAVEQLPTQRVLGSLAEIRLLQILSRDAAALDGV
jgi:hypothetical protein